MYTQVTVAFEVDLNGGVFASKTINTANLSITKRGNRLWFIVLEIIAGMCVTLNMIASFSNMIRYGVREFFSSLWNWLEMLVGIQTLLCVLFFLLRRNSFDRVVEQFKDTEHGLYLDFSEVFLWQNLFHLSMGFFGALVIFKMLKVTTFNPFMKIFTNSVDLGVGDFQAFMFCLIFIIFGFGSLGRLAFGSYVKSYSTFRDTMFTLLFFILGEPDFDVVIGADLFIGRMFFLLFMVISQYFVLFMFIAILRDAFSIARLLQYKYERAVVKHMVNTILLYFNFFSQQSDSQLKVPV